MSNIHSAAEINPQDVVEEGVSVGAETRITAGKVIKQGTYNLLQTSQVGN